MYRRNLAPSSRRSVWKVALQASVLLGLLVAAMGPAMAEEPASRSIARLKAARGGKVLFLGNSITLHGPAPAIGWNANWGMAASAEERDYVHVLTAALGKIVGKSPEIRVANIADFERAFRTYDLDAQLQKALQFRADVVVLAIGENVPALSAGAEQAEFQKSLIQLLTRLKQAGQPEVFVRSCFWPDAVKDEALKNAAAETGCVFVDISPLGGNAANQASSERQFSHAGVAAHPGDRGMQAIADAILAAMVAAH